MKKYLKQQANLSRGAMESRDHSKNGASPKSQTSKEKFLIRECQINRLWKIISVLCVLFLVNISGYTQNRPKGRNSGYGFDFGIGPYYEDERLGSIKGTAFRIGILSNFYSNRVPVLQNFGLMNFQFGPSFSINYGYRFGISPLERTLLRLKPYIELGPSLGLLFIKGEKGATSKGTKSKTDFGINGNLGAGVGFKCFYNNTTALTMAIRIEAMTDILNKKNWSAAQIMLCFTILHF